ncbi:MAG: small multi-drug export protein [Clostridia bacterium]|nr:small multi-drug export protein [Clostridia bacterium]
MQEAITAFLERFFTPDIVVWLLSLLPVSEIRGALIAARAYEMSWLYGLVVGFIGNMLPIPFILLFIRKIFDLMKKIPKLGPVVDRLLKRADQKGQKLGKYELWGLFILVAIPLPGTGAWTGALVATVANMRIKKSLPIIALGVLAAGLIVSFFLYALPLLASGLF